MEAIEADPLDNHARQRLADARHTASESAMNEGRTLLQAGEFTRAAAALTRHKHSGQAARKLHLCSEAHGRGEAMQIGNQLYQDRQYAAALFEFKKAIRFDPDNANARQKMAYAQSFLQDSQLNERFTRLE